MEAHKGDLLFYKQQIASMYDYEAGQRDPTITMLIQERQIRRIA
jgi:hypothetical protein